MYPSKRTVVPLRFPYNKFRARAVTTLLLNHLTQTGDFFCKFEYFNFLSFTSQRTIVCYTKLLELNIDV